MYVPAPIAQAAFSDSGKASSALVVQWVVSGAWCWGLALWWMVVDERLLHCLKWLVCLPRVFVVL